MQDPGLTARHAAQPEHLTLRVLLDWCFHAVWCFFLLIGVCSQLGLRLNVSLALEMKLEDRWIRKVLAARLAIVLLLLFSRLLLVLCGTVLRFGHSSGRLYILAVNFGYGGLPAVEAALVPFPLEHLLSLPRDLAEVDERLRSLEEILEILDQTLHVLSILTGLLDVERDDVELVEVLQPGEVVIALNQAEFPQLTKPTEGKVVLVQIKVLSMALLTGEYLIGLVEHLLHALSKEHLTL